MSIIDLQRRLAEVGRIRIGQQVATNNGKTRPAKLATFRLTSADSTRIAQAAQLYGGNPAQWDAPAGPQWEVVTEADALHVIVPPSDMSFSQHYELWSAGGCQRRCDGRHEAISQGACMCDPEARECQIHTRLSVMLRDLPGLGVWRIDTSGYYAAVELQGAVEVIQVAAGRGQMLPARLRLEQRAVKRAGQTRRFAVPVLDVEVSPGQLMASDEPAALTAPAESRPALTPVPAELTGPPAPSVTEQATGQQPTRKRRSNAAAPVPATDIQPRTAAQAAADKQHDPADGPSPAQTRKLHAMFRERGVHDRTERLQWASEVLGRQLTSSKEMTMDEAGKVIDDLERTRPEPTPADSPVGDWPNTFTAVPEEGGDQ